MAIDSIARGLAANAQDAADTANQKIDMIPRGLNYKGEVDYYSELPAEAEEGDVYSVKYKGESGSELDGTEYAWGKNNDGDFVWIALGADLSGLQNKQKIITESSSSETLMLVNNTETRIDGTVTNLEITSFSGGTSGYTDIYSVVFTTGNGVTVTVPNTVTWAVAEPAFEAGKTYWLSFTSYGAGYIGAWSVIA